MERAIITLKFIDRYGQIETCNIVEPLDSTFRRLQERLDGLKSKGFKRVGDITMQFVIFD